MRVGLLFQMIVVSTLMISSAIVHAELSEQSKAERQTFLELLKQGAVRPSDCGYGSCTFDTDCCSGYCNPMNNTCSDEAGGQCGYGSCTFDTDCCSGYCNPMNNTCSDEAGGQCGYGSCTFDTDCCSNYCDPMTNSCGQLP